MRLLLVAFLSLLFFCNCVAQIIPHSSFDDKFRQLEELLPTPNNQRTGSGAPGKEYWQQRADYKIKVSIDDSNQRLNGTETITYTNNSPDALSYLWLQLDQNLYDLNSDTYLIRQSKLKDEMSYNDILNLTPSYDGGFKIEAVTDNQSKPLKYFINKTMMRVELPTPLLSGKSISFNVKWWYNINDRMKVGGRSGYEYFKADDNYLYTLAHFFPRMVAYYDVYGWQHKQFLGAGEFTLDFGNYDVEITVPADHIVAATGVLQNPESVLTPTQRQRLNRAQKEFSQPVLIITQDEAIENESSRAVHTKTWRFKADNVRDFAFVSSRKFIWDAMAVKQNNGSTVMAMSFYPKEGNPLWEKYSTKAVAHTLKWYSHYTFDYPYPVAISVHTADIGMEYPMICFNGGRPEPDGTYSDRVKYGMISVIIHEVGHNYFPMIVNSDERQWTWMDEGLNTFLQFLAEQQWERNYPSRRGPAHLIVPYMKSEADRLEPIMTNSESLRQFGNNAYGKPATALNILRETVLGRENFDYAFKVYSQRWMFKRPTPADFFRTMEDASGTDLDWFWRGWFYTTDVVDVGIKSVKVKQLSTKNPDIEKELSAKKENQQPDISTIRNQQEIVSTYEEQDTTLIDRHSQIYRFVVSDKEREQFKKMIAALSPEEKALIENRDLYFNEICIELIGELVTPVILKLHYADGSGEDKRYPAEIWKMGNREFCKVILTNKPVVRFELDPYLETADVNTGNNAYPPEIQPSRFELYKRQSGDSNSRIRG